MEEFDFYPNKPELIEKKTVNKGNLSKTVFSIVLFIVTMLMLFENQISIIINLVLVVLIHELGHFLFMKKFKYENVKMLFIPLMGAFVQGKKDEYKLSESVLVILAGPIPGVVLGVISIYLGDVYKVYSLIEIGLIFLFLNLVNLLPLFPLDGGHLLNSLVKKKNERFQLIFSFISSLLVIGFGVYTQQWILVVFGFLLGIRVRSIQRSYHIHKELDDEKVNFNVSYKMLTNRDYSKIKDSLLNFYPSLRMFSRELPEEEVNPILAGQVNSVLVTPIERNLSIFWIVFILLIWVSAFVLPFIFLESIDILSLLHEFQGK